MYSRLAISRAIRRMAETYPEQRIECMRLLMRELQRFETNDPTYNSFVIGELADLQAVEALPLIQRVFAAHKADATVADWEWVQVRFGLISEEEYDRNAEVRAAANRAALGIPDSLVRILSGEQLPPPGWSPAPARTTPAPPAPARKREPRKVAPPPPDPAAKAKRKLIESARRKDRKRK
jgi:hypothetical protein